MEKHCRCFPKPVQYISALVFMLLDHILGIYPEAAQQGEAVKLRPCALYV